MIYIVSGIHRSGTSVMMRALVDGGITPYWSEVRENQMMANKNNDDKYHVNASGFWEAGQQQYRQFGFTSRIPDNCCVKIQAAGLPIIAAGHGIQYTIIFMRRHPEEIKQSYIKAFGERDFKKSYSNWGEYYPVLTNGVIEIMKARVDVELVEVRYDSLINNPVKTFKRLFYDYLVPIDVQKAASVIDKRLRHFEIA